MFARDLHLYKFGLYPQIIRRLISILSTLPSSFIRCYHYIYMSVHYISVPSRYIYIPAYISMQCLYIIHKPFYLKFTHKTHSTIFLFFDIIFLRNIRALMSKNEIVVKNDRCTENMVTNFEIQEYKTYEKFDSTRNQCFMISVLFEELIDSVALLKSV